MAIDNYKLIPVLTGIHLVGLPLYTRMPVSILFILGMFTLWTLLIIAGRTPKPSRVIRVILVGVIMLSLLMSYGSIVGQEPGTSMLLMLSFLKLFEMKDKRDVVLVIFISFFLIASNFFHTQSPWIAVYIFAVVVYLTSLLIIFSDRLGTMDFKSRIHVSGKMIAQASPLMLILFVLFPRIPGPLWALPDDAQAAKTGIGEEMSPGSIDALIGSGAVAFRVKFDDEPPAREDLYWRGLVLSKYDGKTWRRDDAPSYTRPEVTYVNDKAEIKEYTITLEPHSRDWLYSLETMISYDRKYKVSRELQVYATNKINDVIIYKMKSNLHVINHGLFEPELRKNTALPARLNPRMVKLAKHLVKQANGDAENFVNLVLAHFRKEEFYYTLSPPLLGKHAMDDFLFDTRRGFCEHYASAFVNLMRAGGLPARVVIGYQGGNVNPVDDYMIVRQSDAHAWAEVWLNKEGWVRIDPTAAVAPNRIERGIQGSGVELARLPSILISNNSFLLKTRYMWDSFNYSWNQWIVGFNDKKQKELFANLGFENINASTLVLWLVVMMSVCGGLIALWVFRRNPGKEKDRTRYYYNVFCNKLEKAGIARKPNEGPREYLSRIAGYLPAVGDNASTIIGYYQDLRYGDKTDENLKKQFVRSVMQFKVKRGK